MWETLSQRSGGCLHYRVLVLLYYSFFSQGWKLTGGQVLQHEMFPGLKLKRNLFEHPKFYEALFEVGSSLLMKIQRSHQSLRCGISPRSLFHPRVSTKFAVAIPTIVLGHNSVPFSLVKLLVKNPVPSPDKTFLAFRPFWEIRLPLGTPMLGTGAECTATLITTVPLHVYADKDVYADLCRFIYPRTNKITNTWTLLYGDASAQT